MMLPVPVIASSLAPVETELARWSPVAPTRKWELMPTVFEAKLKGVLTLHP